MNVEDWIKKVAFDLEEFQKRGEVTRKDIAVVTSRLAVSVYIINQLVMYLGVTMPLVEIMDTPSFTPSPQFHENLRKSKVVGRAVINDIHNMISGVEQVEFENDVTNS